jgi:hypothetical protein
VPSSHRINLGEGYCDRIYWFAVSDNWLVVWNMTFIFLYIGNNHPNWLIFFRGVETTNQILS